MSRYQIQALLRINQVIHQIRALDGATLTPTEREARADMLAQAYDRAAYFLQEERDDSIDIREQIRTIVKKSHKDHRNRDETAWKAGMDLDKYLVYQVHL